MTSPRRVVCCGRHGWAFHFDTQGHADGFTFVVEGNTSLRGAAAA